MKQVHVFYSGQVQGVGFRYTTVNTARHFKVTGGVRNLRDGRVELVAEGEEQEINAFLEQVRQGPLRHNITDVQLAWSEATGQHQDFRSWPTADTPSR